MSDLDLTDLLSDTDLAGTSFTVRRQRQVDNDNGTTSFVLTDIPAFGQVAPTSHNSVVRQAAYQNGQNSIVVNTGFRLQMPAKRNDGKYLGDYVIWDGNPYTIETLNEYFHFGQGFCEAECVSTVLVETATNL